MIKFHNSFQKINLLLFFCGICPFLRNATSSKYECSTLSTLYTLCLLGFYISSLAVVQWLGLMDTFSFLSTKSSFNNFIAYFELYIIFLTFVIIMQLTITNRFVHAEFFNILIEFDQKLCDNFNVLIDYKQLNVGFLFEIGIWTIFCAFILNFTQGYFILGLSSLKMLLYYMVYDMKVLHFGFQVVYMKNCINFIRVRNSKIAQTLDRIVCEVNEYHLNNENAQINCYIKCHLLWEAIHDCAKLRHCANKVFGNHIVYITVYAMLGGTIQTYRVFKEFTNIKELQPFIFIDFLFYQIPICCLIITFYKTVHSADKPVS